MKRKIIPPICGIIFGVYMFFSEPSHGLYSRQNFVVSVLFGLFVTTLMYFGVIFAEREKVRIYATDPPILEPEEKVIGVTWAMRIQGIRQTCGCLYLTSSRLIFRPSSYYFKKGEQEQFIPITNIAEFKSARPQWFTLIRCLVITDRSGVVNAYKVPFLKIWLEKLSLAPTTVQT